MEQYKNIVFRYRNAGISLLILLLAGGIKYADESISETKEPYSFLLTWQKDPSTTMTIDWHTDPVMESIIQYRRIGSNIWHTRSGNSFPFPYSNNRMVHRYEITNLRADTRYEFRFSEKGKIYRFRTMPSQLNRPVLFATGGDMMHHARDFGALNEVAVQYDLDFVVIGGDLAYADGRPENLQRWYDYLETWSKTMIRPDGRVIPHIAGIGNHEIKRGYFNNYPPENRFDDTDAWRLREGPYFFNLIAFPGLPGYGVLDFGNYLSLVLLDTDHANPIVGEQTKWLEMTLANRREFKHVIPVYHVPAWPSVRDPDGNVTLKVRNNFVPAFEKYSNVRVAFENHDHAYKKTHPIRNNQVSPTGIVYMGDGAWGVGVRNIGPHYGTEKGWYLDNAQSYHHFILVELRDEDMNISVIGRNGVQFDSVYFPSFRSLDVTSDTGQLPVTTTLDQNYPNPFNSNTIIRFGITEPAPVKLEIFTLQGQLVTTLVDQNLGPGWHTARLDASRLTSGTYMYRLRVDDQVFSKKLILLK